MIVKVGEKSYQLVGIQSIQHRLSFRQLVQLQRDLAVNDISRCKTLQDILDLVAEVPSMTLAELNEHPEGLFLLGVMVWASRVASGEQVGLLDALDFDLAGMDFIPEPGDEVAGAEGKA